MTSTTNWVNDKIGKDDIVIFSKSSCGFCLESKLLLESLGVPYHAYELDQIKEGKNMMPQVL